MGSTPCPGCGIAVTIGYAKCPRCHAPMPGTSRTKRASVAGGTSVDGPEEFASAAAGNGRLVIAIVLGVAVLIAAVLVARSLGAEPSRGPGAGTADVAPETPEAPTTPSGNSDLLPPPTTAAAPDPSVAAAALERAIAGARLFGTVQVQGDTLEIRSGACTDAIMTAEVGRVAADLRAGGVTTVRCRELHGAEVFARPL